MWHRYAADMEFCVDLESILRQVVEFGLGSATGDACPTRIRALGWLHEKAFPSVVQFAAQMVATRKHKRPEKCNGCCKYARMGGLPHWFYVFRLQKSCLAFKRKFHLVGIGHFYTYRCNSRVIDRYPLHVVTLYERSPLR